MFGNKEQKSNRIPVRFVDEESMSAQEEADDRRESGAESDDRLTPDEIGRESAYEDETEVRRRIERGAEEDGERADDSDTAGGPREDETPEQREDTDEATTQKASASSGEKDDAGSSSSKMNAAAGPLMAELVAARAELRRLETERAELVDQLARRQADFENYRKRVERERTETYNRMVGDVVSKLLPVLDNLRRALDTEAILQASESEEFRHFLQGVELIYKQLTDVLQGLGLEPVPSVGELFDPHVHEAVMTEQTEDYEPDTVMQEIVRGYRLGDKLLRPAIVKVATR
ncbi:MAG: nucleotide exchange factor GrpE [Pyrinomonadaceae bacterium]